MILAAGFFFLTVLQDWKLGFNASWHISLVTDWRRRIPRETGHFMFVISFGVPENSNVAGAHAECLYFLF